MTAISSSLQAKNAKAGVHKVAGASGLYLKIGDAGVGSYYVRFRLGDRRPSMGLGSRDEISLADAREAARAAVALARQGVNPIEARRLEPPKRLRQRLTRAEAPGLIHLYRHYDFAGKLLYVGVAKNTLRRWNGHQRAAMWADLVAVITIDHYPTQEEAEAAENAAILAEKPRFNNRVLLKPRKMKS